MPPRLFNLPSIHSPIQPPRYPSCLFHWTRVLKAVGAVDYYKTLELDHNASPVDIKKSFYALSKKHHPDHNPNDIHAAERFVKISEAYAILGNPPKREKYDRESQGTASNSAPKGSYSSSAPYGARPASGLSKRRTQFRGPPPSFYRHGAWGLHGAKRQQQADSTATGHAAAASGLGASTAGGFGPAGSPDGLDNDVPHFDRQGHIRTQEQQDQRRVRRAGEQAIDYVYGGSIFLNFVFISGILVVACLIPVVFVNRKSGRRRGHENSS